jgi:hypothetical protein
LYELDDLGHILRIKRKLPLPGKMAVLP